MTQFAFLNNPTFKILITDSGLGGISVCAEIEELSHRNMNYSRLNLIYYNSFPKKNYGYNSMSDTSEKVSVFNEALNGMLKFEPDVILIACNTLSVIYHLTDFSKKTTIPVIGIVDFGVEMLVDALKKDENSFVIILGTPTTISSNAHAERLIQKGIASERIINQSCPTLESEIQQHPASERVGKLIEKYISEAFQYKPADYKKALVALCCTHYGFSIPLFSEILQKKTGGNFQILNPNHRMSMFLFPENLNQRFEGSEINIELYTKTMLNRIDIQILADLIHQNSPQTAKALNHFIFWEDLFQI
jgi:glutamate racemase